jgi:hypothetical protein
VGWIHRLNDKNGGVYIHLDLMSSAAPHDTLIVGLPFANSKKLGAHAADQQGKGVSGAPTWDRYGQCLLSTAEGGVVGHGPILGRDRQHAGHNFKPMTEQEFEHGLDRRLGEHSRPTGNAVMRRETFNVLSKTHQKGAAHAKRRSVAGPIRRAVADGCRPRRAACLTTWTHHVIPSGSKVFNDNRLPRSPRSRPSEAPSIPGERSMGSDLPLLFHPTATGAGC